MHYLRNSILTVCLLLALGVGLVGCDSITDGYDNDPNSPREVSPDLTLNGGQVGLITLLEANFARVASIFSQQMTGSTRQYNRIENGYDVSAGDFDNMWSTGYADTINEMGVVKEQGRATGANVLVNIAKIQEAHAFGTFAALFGDVPFSETNKGSENLNPGFDDQVTIYDSIQDSLGAAASALEAYQNNSNAPPLSIAFGDTDLDLFYGGDVDKWVKVAYSLKARYHLHQGEYQAALDAANQGILDSENDWIAPHGTSFGSNSNLWFNFFILRGGYLTAEDAYAPKLLDNPLLTGSSNAEYRGNAKTDEGSRYFSHYYQLPAGSGNYQVEFAPVFGFGGSFPLFRASETHLIRAEAIMKLKDSQSGLSRQDAVDALNEARDANEAYYTGILPACAVVAPGDPTTCYQDYVVADFESGGISRDTPSDVTETTDNAILTEILEEKYLSTISNIEGWNEVRRTENFLNIPTKQGASEFPERWPYAQIELSSNSNAPQPPPSSEETKVNANLDYQPIDN